MVPERIKRFLVNADMHSNISVMKHAVEVIEECNKIDIHLIAGDLMMFGKNSGLKHIFGRNYHNKPMVIAIGNHDLASKNPSIK